MTSFKVARPKLKRKWDSMRLVTDRVPDGQRSRAGRNAAFVQKSTERRLARKRTIQKQRTALAAPAAAPADSCIDCERRWVPEDQRKEHEWWKLRDQRLICFLESRLICLKHSVLTGFQSYQTATPQSTTVSSTIARLVSEHT